MRKQTRKQKKVFLCITKSNWGGAQKYVADIARSADAQEHLDVAVVVGRHEREGEDVFRRTLKEAGIRIIDLPYSGRALSLVNDIRTCIDLIRIFRVEQPDVVHLNSSKIAGLGAIAAWLTHVPRRIYTIHGLPFLEDRVWWVGILMRVATYCTCILVTRVITISQSEARRIASWPLVGKRVVTIYNGIAEALLLSRNEARGVLARTCDIDCTGKVIIGSIAELTRNKGHAYLLLALSALKKEGVPFVFANFGGGELAEELNKRTQELGLTENVHWFGFVPDAYHYLRAFDIFVLPSVKEGLPFTLLEAGCANLPVVATDVGGVSEIITSETGILVPAKNPRAITEALRVLIADTEKRDVFAAALNQHVTEHFSLTRMCEHTIALYLQ